MHLVVARLLSMSVIFCLLWTSNMCRDFKPLLLFKVATHMFDVQSRQKMTDNKLNGDLKEGYRQKQYLYDV